MVFKLIIDRELCKECRLCVIFCPAGVLEMSAEFNANGFHYPAVKAPDACTGCKHCALMCPEAAIEIAKSSEEKKKKAKEIPAGG